MNNDQPSEFLFHEACNSCGSSDAGSRYSDGHFFCHVCRHYEPGDGVTASSKTNKHHSIELKGDAVKLTSRGIKTATCQRYQVLKDGDCLRFYYRNRSGSIVAAKVKNTKKEFWWEGSNSDHQFFGQHLVGASSRSDFVSRLVITEGELDCLSIAEVFPNYNVVSLPDGAAAAKKAVQHQLEWLQQFGEIVLFFDNDSAGKQATDDVANVLPTGTVKLAKLQDEYKDASDALQAGDIDSLKKAIWNAESWVPGGIVGWASMASEICTPNPPCLHHYPWGGLDSLLHGIRDRELITVTAGSGIGKSSLLRQLAVHLLESGESVGYLALEESNRRTGFGLMSAYLGQPFHLGVYTSQELMDAYEKTKHWKLHMFDGFGSYDPEIIYRRVEYLALGLDVKFVFLDHLSILLSGQEGDERRMIDLTMTRLRSLVERTGIGLYLVCHLSGSGDGGSYEEGGRVKLTNLRGSKAIGQLSDAVIALERDQQENTDTTIRVLKNRLVGKTGPASVVRWDGDKCIYQEVESTAPMTPESAAKMFEDC